MTFFSIKQDTFLILKLLITFLKEIVDGQRSFSAKSTGLHFNFDRLHFQSRKPLQTHYILFAPFEREREREREIEREGERKRDRGHIDILS